MGHHPLLSYGLHYGETTYLTDLLGGSLADIDLYCCGHEHDLEYIEQPGLPPVLLSGTSSESRGISPTPDAAFASGDYGFACLSVDHQQIGITFYDGNSAAILHQHSVQR